MISVIIPSHNEERVIARCIESLLNGADADELEVVVVCNGCADRTAEVAGGFGRVRVIETPVASKTNALNLGDAVAVGFPRFYVDADVVISLTTLRLLAARLDERKLYAIAPTPMFDVSGSSWGVRAYYEVHGRLPASREGIGGSGVYGLSERGRRRFERFPDVTADDGFVRLQFSPDERETMGDCRSIVRVPKTFRELIAIKTRSHFGTMQLRQRMPELWGNVGLRNGPALRGLALRSPLLWPKLGAYAMVKAVARLRAGRQMRAGSIVIWERDETSRKAARNGAGI